MCAVQLSCYVWLRIAGLLRSTIIAIDVAKDRDIIYILFNCFSHVAYWLYSVVEFGRFALLITVNGFL